MVHRASVFTNASYFQLFPKIFAFILAGKPVCINLINFRTLGFFPRISTLRFHRMQAFWFPSFCRFVSFPFAIFSIAAFYCLWLSLLMWMLLAFRLVIRLLLLIALQLSPADSSSFESFHFAMDGITCWSSLQSFKERLLFWLFRFPSYWFESFTCYSIFFKA